MIIKCTKYDLLQLPMKEGQYYYVTDLRCMYKDYGRDRSQRKTFWALIVNSENERNVRVKPDNGKFYYVVETNNLWCFDTKWRLIEGDIRRYNAYAYSYNNGISPVVSTDDNITSSETGDRIIDNNGLLGDGSVVIRDHNRIIKGVNNVIPQRQEIALTSYLDNGISLYPYGLASSLEERTKFGSLHLGVTRKEANNEFQDEMKTQGKAEYYGDLFVVGNIHNVTPIDVFTAPKELYPGRYVPTNTQELRHYFVRTRTVTSNNVSTVEHYDFRIDKITETSAKVTITKYTNDAPTVVTADDAMIYDESFVWGSETTYDAIRSAESNVEIETGFIGDRVTYTLVGTDREVVITLQGEALGHLVLSTNIDEYFELNTQLTVNTELFNICCLSTAKNELPNDTSQLPYVTPQMYGAKADGITNDSDAIQAAINGNKEVFFPEGTYKIEKAIKIPSNRSIRGTIGSVIIGTRPFVIDNNNSTTNYDEENENIIDGFYTESPKKTKGQWSTDIKIDTLTIKNCACPLYIDSTHGVFNNLNLTHSTLGCYINQDSFGNDFNNCKFEYNYVGIKSPFICTTTFTNCCIQWNIQYGIQANFNVVTMTGCYIEANGIYKSGGMNSIIPIENTAGIYIPDGVDNIYKPTAQLCLVGVDFESNGACAIRHDNTRGAFDVTFVGGQIIGTYYTKPSDNNPDELEPDEEKNAVTKAMIWFNIDNNIHRWLFLGTKVLENENMLDKQIAGYAGGTHGTYLYTNRRFDKRNKNIYQRYSADGTIAGAEPTT